MTWPRREWVWRQIPNALSSARILSSPVLVTFALMGRESAFKWLLLAAMLSDTVDGVIARAQKRQSPRGAFLDSTGDVLVTLAAIVGVISLRWSFVEEHYGPLLLMVGLYFVEVAAALARYGRVSSFHTYLARSAAYAQALFVMSLFFFGYLGWLFSTTVILTVVAYLEELALIYLLPEWRSDVRGIYWVLRLR